MYSAPPFFCPYPPHRVLPQHRPFPYPIAFPGPYSPHPVVYPPYHYLAPLPKQPAAVSPNPAPSPPPSPPPMADYVVWSHRPSDPASAPGIIIARHARPPHDVIQKARLLPAPPPPEPRCPVDSTEATSTAPDTSVPPSPVSSHTSLSESPPKPKQSWASLFGNDTAANTLPTSSVVGISVPASAPPARSPVSAPKLLSLLTTGPFTQAIPKIRPRGLVNTGNMCFANAVLQVLVYCPPFWRLFRELDTFTMPDETPLVDATVRFLNAFVPNEQDDDVMDSFIPTYIYDALKEKKRFDHMRGGHQEDAEEFLGFYLDTLEEELLSIVSSLGHPPPQEDGPWLEVGKRNRTTLSRMVKSTESPITRMFGGQFRSTLRVPHQKDSVRVEDWRSLRLDIQRDQIHTIKDALAYISSPQSVQVTSVTRPGAVLDATQTVHIDSLPPILILHLKRFLYDANAGGVAKVNKQVAFAPELDVPGEVMAQGKKLHGTRYKLFGVLYHHGLSASGGHYTLDVLHPNIDNSPATKPREGWIRIDDEYVSDVRSEDVFGTPERDDRCAYLLFYRRVGVVRS